MRVTMSIVRECMGSKRSTPACEAVYTPHAALAIFAFIQRWRQLIQNSHLCRYRKLPPQEALHEVNPFGCIAIHSISKQQCVCRHAS